MQDRSRYIIGIDLGTTNSCVSYIDTDIAKNPRLQVRMLPILQCISMGLAEPKHLLPSFYYLPASGELMEGSTRLPWEKQMRHDAFVGVFAREHGAKVPTRLVQSAKSWLCNSAAERKEKILPLEAADVSIRVSPVEVTAAYLRHIVEAWNHQMSKGDPALEFQEQEVVLTVPASFDEVARLLTVEAAKLAGFAKLTLLEEPQAAFYGWLLEHEDSWKGLFKDGDAVVVCDVGGGTTDFSLIVVKADEHASLSFQRMAVGNHLLLGGDNMDQAICHFLDQKLKGDHSLDSKQWLQLLAAARQAKEVLLGDNPPDSFSVCIQGAGSRVISGSISVEVKREELEALLLNGFFGDYPWDEAVQLNKSTGLRSMGLPYEADPSITKHLASFLKKSGINKPRYVLFNGGTMKPLHFRQAILKNLSRWFGEPVQELSSASLDLAVSRGAAYFAKARRGLGTRIGGGIPRSFYLVIDVKDKEGKVSKQALTLLPRGSKEGIKVESKRVFMLMPNSPVSFHLLTSHTRLNDAPGDIVELNEEELFPLPPIRTVLRYGKKSVLTEMIPVKLEMLLSEIGTLELWLKSQSTEHRWKLEFQLRTAAGEENSLLALEQRGRDEVLGEEELQPAKQLIMDVFSGASPLQPGKLMAELERLLEMPKNDWPPGVLRGLFDASLKLALQRTQSTQHESRWWNLIGFLLRPGYGYPLDDFRIKDLWKVILGDLKKDKNPETLIQTWICYRRIAGGFNKGQQTQLVGDLLSETIAQINPQRGSKSKMDANEYSEKLRMIASMELLDISSKIKLGDALIKRMTAGRGLPCDYWALGRLGARHLIRGSIANVMPKDHCTRWIETLLQSKQNEEAFFLMEQLARKTSFREVNLPDPLIQQILSAYQSHPNIERLRRLLTEDIPLTSQEQDRIFGEHLPSGLTLMA